MSNVATQETGLVVIFNPNFILPEVAYYYTPESGTPCLGIASVFEDCPRVIWQIKFLARALAKRQGVREAIFEIVGNTIIPRVL